MRVTRMLGWSVKWDVKEFTKRSVGNKVFIRSPRKDRGMVWRDDTPARYATT